MRSYHAHLETLAPTAGLIAKKPVFRASAVFPVIREGGISTRLIFMGYWFLKRNVQKVESVLTLRSLEGKVLLRSIQSIVESKTYRIELASLLDKLDIPLEQAFTGSLEVEFYSSSNLVFPYPAVVVNYYGPAFSSVVHVAQRVYNDYEDMEKNSQTDVPESGFNIYADANQEPLIGLINGPEPQNHGQIELQFFNGKGETLNYTKELGVLHPYQTTFIYPAREVDLEGFLGGNVGACKAKFQVNWIFPRLLVGNLQREPRAFSVTHTYYDCSSAVSESDYWNDPEPGFEPASLMIPFCCEKDYLTKVYFYPIYSPSEIGIDIEVYGQEGELLEKKENILTLKSPSDAFSCLNLKELFSLSQNSAIRIIARPLEGSRLPARIKLGVDIGILRGLLPCNICTNLQPFNPSLETKTSSFKWLPLLTDQPRAAVWLMNSSPQKNYVKVATLDVTFFREKDTQILKKFLELEPHGFVMIDPNDDVALKEFLDGQIGWMTIVTNNPYLTTYYFADHPSGVVGGDHGF